MATESERKRKHEYYLKNREKILARTREYQKANPERSKAIQQKWYADNIEKKKQQSHDSYMRRRELVSQKYQENKEQKQEYNRQYYQENKKTAAEYNRRYAQRLRLQLINILGGIRCSNPNCPIPPEKLDYRGIQLDHINADANKDRFFINSQDKYRHYITHPEQAKLTYQTLCAYCNWMKRQINGEYTSERYRPKKTT